MGGGKGRQKENQENGEPKMKDWLSDAPNMRGESKVKPCGQKLRGGAISGHKARGTEKTEKKNKGPRG